MLRRRAHGASTTLLHPQFMLSKLVGLNSDFVTPDPVDLSIQQPIRQIFRRSRYIRAYWLTRCDNVDDENDGREPFRYRRRIDESLLVPRHVISTQQAKRDYTGQWTV